MMLRRKYNGAKYSAEAADLCKQVVGERFPRAEVLAQARVDCGEVIMLT